MRKREIICIVIATLVALLATTVFVVWQLTTDPIAEEREELFAFEEEIRGDVQRIMSEENVEMTTKNDRIKLKITNSVGTLTVNYDKEFNVLQKDFNSDWWFLDSTLEIVCFYLMNMCLGAMLGMTISSFLPKKPKQDKTNTISHERVMEIIGLKE